MAEYNWHDDFYTRKVFPQICKDAGECTGFFAWLEVADRQRYDEILRLEQVIDEIWLSQGDRISFQSACRDWYKEVLLGIAKWREAMAVPRPSVVCVEPVQERMRL